MINEGNQIHNYLIIYCVFVRTFVIPFYYGSGTVISYGSGYGSTRPKVTVPTVPVPHGKKLRFLRLRFHTAKSYGSYGYGSTRQKDTVHTAVPVAQQCLEEDLAGHLQGALLGE
jgi:hypothetical protein